jgi:hypothetical protein
MKKMIVMLLMLITIGAFAQDPQQLKQMTILELSDKRDIRVEKLTELIAPGIDAEELEIPLEKIDSGITNAFIETTLEGYISTRTLLDLSEDTKYPVKKLAGKLGLEIDKLEYDMPLRELGISNQKVNRAIRSYEEEESGFLWNIVATGMVIVFIALIITGLIVALLEYFHRLHTQKIRRKTDAPTEKLSAIAPFSESHMSKRMERRLAITSRPMGSDEMLDAHTVVAIATAIRLHEAALEEENRILATWTKAQTSTWKTSRVMPNRGYFSNRWGKS